MADWFIERWDGAHSRFADLQRCVAAEGQMHWATGEYVESFDAHYWLVAQSKEKENAEGGVIGFLFFVLQSIGPEHDCDPLLQNGVELTQAKIICFGVPEAYRRRGIGRALQEAAIQWARELDCYQVRSWSEATHPENHALKLSIGFAALPERRSETTHGVYYIMPLRTQGATNKP